MNKAELIDKIGSDAKINKTQACAAIDALTNLLMNTLEKGKKMNLIGLGIFSVYNRPARKGRNPQTGTMIKIREKKVVKFRMGPEMKDNLNKTQPNFNSVRVMNAI